MDRGKGQLKNEKRYYWVSPECLPAAPAGTDRRVPNGIQIGDMIEVQSLEQDGQ